MDSEQSAALSATQRHHKYMSFGKKQRYIEVFQCSIDDMNLVLTGGVPVQRPLLSSGQFQRLTVCSTCILTCFSFSTFVSRREPSPASQLRKLSILTKWSSSPRSCSCSDCCCCSPSPSLLLSSCHLLAVSQSSRLSLHVLYSLTTIVIPILCLYSKSYVNK